jgi:ABC-type transport system substrate-binding protein
MRRPRRRPLHLAVSSLALALVLAACGGGGGGGGTGSSATATKDGGTLSYAADQEPTGFNNNTSKDNGTSVLNVVINIFRACSSTRS